MLQFLLELLRCSCHKDLSNNKRSHENRTRTQSNNAKCALLTPLSILPNGEFTRSGQLLSNALANWRVTRQMARDTTR